MESRRRFVPVWVAGLLSVIVASGGANHWVPGRDPAFPLVRYDDSLTSANDHCIISGLKLNPRMAPTYVNGVPIGYC